MDLEKSKLGFLESYNRRLPTGEWDCSLALTSGVKAAAQHNALYARGSSWRQKEVVRADWKRLLADLSEKYVRRVGSSSYEEDIQVLANEMNSLQGALLRSAGELRDGYAPGFRISHAQKSLSVYLKHLWCMGDIEMPPECPIDRAVLRHANVYDPWTRVNSIDRHRNMVERLRKRVHGLPLAEWELEFFQK